MAEESKIAWTHSTFNPWEGCTRVSPGCKHCYAETRNNRWHDGRHWGPHAPRLERSASYWRKPIKWNREAEESGQPWRVFCASVADVFERLPDDHPQREWMAQQRQRLWALIHATPYLTWMFLTKRPQNVLRMVPRRWWTATDGETRSAEHWPRNVWVGTTVEDQQRADERIPDLQNIPAPVRFLSVEPMLGPVSLDFLAWRRCSFCGHRGGCLCACPGGESFHRRLVDWVICGGESGPNARPFDLAWARSLRDQCAAAGVPFFFKQYGQNTVGLLEQPPRHLLDDQTWHAPDLRVRQFP